MDRMASHFAPPIFADPHPCAGDRVRVAHGVFGKLGTITSTSPGHVVVHYDRGDREIVDPTRRSIWIVD